MESPLESFHETSITSDISLNLAIHHTVVGDTLWTTMELLPDLSKQLSQKQAYGHKKLHIDLLFFKSQLLCWNLRTEQQFPNSGMLKAALISQCLSFRATIKIQSSDPWNENKSKARGIVQFGGTPRGLAPCSSKLRRWFGCLIAGLEVEAAMTKRVES